MFGLQAGEALVERLDAMFQGCGPTGRTALIAIHGEQATQVVKFRTSGQLADLVALAQVTFLEARRVAALPANAQWSDPGWWE